MPKSNLRPQIGILIRVAIPVSSPRGDAAPSPVSGAGGGTIGPWKSGDGVLLPDSTTPTTAAAAFAVPDPATTVVALPNASTSAAELAVFVGRAAAVAVPVAAAAAYSVSATAAGGGCCAAAAVVALYEG